GLDHLALRAEITIERLLADAELGDDRVDAHRTDTLPIEQAVDGLQDLGAGDIFILLHCHRIRACFFGRCSATAANLIHNRLAIKRFSRSARFSAKYAGKSLHLVFNAVVSEGGPALLLLTSREQRR